VKEADEIIQMLEKLKKEQENDWIFNLRA
jgi:hypothetical protein